MNNYLQSANHPYAGNKLKTDFRSPARKAADYIIMMARLAGAQDEKFILNSLRVIEAFGHNPALIQNQVNMVQQRLSQRIDERMRGQHDFPGRNIFRGGKINTGKIIGSDTEALLRINQFSGNMVIYGQYGMGKTNLLLSIIPQLISQGIHVDIFDVARDFRDILQIPGCENGLVLNPDTEKLNPLEPVGDPEDYLQFFWEITQQDFNFKPDTKELLFNYSYELYKKFGVFEGKNPPTLFDLKAFLEEHKSKKATSRSDKNKIETAFRKLNYILRSFKNMVKCSRGYKSDTLDRFPFVSYELGDLSEDKVSWLIKLKLKQYQHKGLTNKQRHSVFRIIVVDEAKGIFGKSRIGDSTNYIKDMFTKSRSIGCWWIISDQFASELANFTRLASVQMCFQHTSSKEIREIVAGMGCDDNVKLKIPRLGRYKALQKIAEYPLPYPIATYKSPVRKHIDDNELDNLMQEKITRLNYISSDRTRNKNIKLLSEPEVIPEIKKEPITEINSKPEKNPLEELEMFLKYVNKNPKTKLTQIYKALNFSCRKGTAIKNKLKDNGLIEEVVVQTGGKGRPLIETKLTPKGKEYINEK